MNDAYLPEYKTAHWRQRAFLPWVVWVLGITVVIAQFLIQLSSALIIQPLMNSFSISAFGAGILSSAYYYTYVTSQLPAGILIDRYKPRILLLLGGIISTIGAFLFGLTHSVIIAGFARMLLGLGFSFAFVSSIYLSRHWFPRHRLPIMIGLVEMVGLIATLFASPSAAIVFERFGWRNTMLGFTVFNALLTLLCWLIIRNHNPLLKPIETPPRTTTKVWNNLVYIAKQPHSWWGGIYIGLLFSVAGVFVSLWGVPFLVIEKHISNAQASFLGSLIFAGIAVAGPIWGLLYTRTPSHKIHLLLGFSPLIAAVLMGLIIFIPNLSIGATGLCIFFSGTTSGSYILAYTAAHDLAPPGAENAALGMANMLGTLSSPILQPLVGFLLDYSTQHPLHGAAPHPFHYLLSDYQFALFLQPLIFLIAAWLGFTRPIVKILTPTLK